MSIHTMYTHAEKKTRENSIGLAVAVVGSSTTTPHTKCGAMYHSNLIKIQHANVSFWCLVAISLFIYNYHFQNGQLVRDPEWDSFF